MSELRETIKNYMYRFGLDLKKEPSALDWPIDDNVDAILDAVIAALPLHVTSAKDFNFASGYNEALAYARAILQAAKTPNKDNK